MSKSPFRDLRVWNDAVELSTFVYRVTSKFPADERFGLTNQMRRASVSVASNIAEGSARASKKEYLNFLSIARGSLAELETQAEIAGQMRLLANADDLDARLGAVSRQLQALINSVRRALQ